MRNTKLMGIMALASCVMLAGCGPKNPEEPKSHTHIDVEPKDHICDICNQRIDQTGGLIFPDHFDSNVDGKCDYCGEDIIPVTPEPGQEAMIQIVGLPSEITVGEAFDLAPFIKLRESGKADINLNVDSSRICSINGTKLTPQDEGTIKFEVSFKGEFVVQTIRAIDPLRVEFLKLLNSVSRTYALYEDEYLMDEDTDELILDKDGNPIVAATNRVAFHNDDYCYFPDFFAADGEEEEENPRMVPGGIVNLDGTYFPYSMDPETGVNKLVPQLFSKDIFTRFNNVLSETIPERFLKIVDSQAHPGTKALGMYEVNSGIAEDVSLCLLGLASVTNQITGAQTVVKYIEFNQIERENKDGVMEKLWEFVPYFNNQSSKLIGQPKGHFLFSTPEAPLGEEGFTIDYIENVIEEHEMPETIDYEDLKSSLSSLFTANNFTVSYDFGWLNALNKETTAPDFAGTYFEKAKDAFINGSSTTVVTEDSFADFRYDKDGNLDYASGRMTVEGEFYNFALVSKGTFDAAKSSYSGMEDTYFDRYAFLNPDEAEESFPEDLCFDSMYFSADKCTAYYMNVGRQNEIFTNLILRCDILAPIYTEAILEGMKETDSDFRDYFDSFFIVYDNGDVELETMFSWDDDHTFLASIYFDQIGTSVIPEEIVGGVTGAIAK